MWYKFMQPVLDSHNSHKQNSQRKMLLYSTYLNQHRYFRSILGWRRDQGEVCGDKFIPSWKEKLVVMLHLAPLLNKLGLNLTEVVL